ncbi:RDD family protein [Streptomyces sp. NBC_01351]|uniref:RDD family protein n=1 Tax=Streptomyces sp. NBC_01351 TaxID=2903833 RepID=UPI002E3162F9|nr:RDD family protein [Streptomyces sp. NBC_01351]
MAREGYYPDPSIPGYVRYWNGLSWVPGTSRPAVRSDETGPVFLDEPAVWQADPVHQAGFGGPRDRRVSWGNDPDPARPGISLARPPEDDAEPPAPHSTPAEDSLRRGRVGGGASPQGAEHDPPRPTDPWERSTPEEPPRRTPGHGGTPPTPPSASTAWPDAAGAAVSGLTASWPEAEPPAEPRAPRARESWDEAPAEPRAPRAREPWDEPPAEPRAPRARESWDEAPAEPRPPRARESWDEPPAEPRAPRARESWDEAPAEPRAPRARESWDEAPAEPRAPRARESWDEPPAEPRPPRAREPWDEAPAEPRAPRAREPWDEPPAEPRPPRAREPWDEAPAEPRAPRAREPWDEAPAEPRPPRAREPWDEAPAEPRAPRARESWDEAPAEPRPPRAREPWDEAPRTASRQSAADSDARPEVWPPRAAGARPVLPRPAQETPPAREPRGAQPTRAEATRTPAAQSRAESARAVFERMAERAVRPAGLGRRAVARALDSLVFAAVAAATALPLVPAATAHVQAKVDTARASGRATTVWLLDATVAGQLGLVLGVVLLFGVLYEVLPTARWGRTPGKKLLGIRVLATATLRPPRFGAALRRWLVYAFLGLPGSLWCLVDRPRRQAWHDKAAKTYVSR